MGTVGRRIIDMDVEQLLKMLNAAYAHDGTPGLTAIRG